MPLPRRLVLIASFLLVAAGPAFAQPSTDAAAVTTANEAFYAALSTLDAAALEPLWVQAPYVTWIGPRNRTPDVGWPAIQAMLKGFGERFSQLSLKPADVQVHVSGTLAWAVGREIQEATFKDGRTANATLLVTNVFEKKDGRWLLVSHHANVAPQ